MNPTEQYIHVMYIIPPLFQGENLKKKYTFVVLYGGNAFEERNKKDSLLPGQRLGGHR